MKSWAAQQAMQSRPLFGSTMVSYPTSNGYQHKILHILLMIGVVCHTFELGDRGAGCVCVWLEPACRLSVSTNKSCMWINQLHRALSVQQEVEGNRLKTVRNAASAASGMIRSGNHDAPNSVRTSQSNVVHAKRSRTVHFMCCMMPCAGTCACIQLT
jgi:hypothetical protein